MDRIEELLPMVQEDTPPYDRNLIELDLLSGLVEEYEEDHYPIKAPTLIEAIKLRMFEMGLNQTKLSELLGVSTSRVSDYLNGRCEPTLQVAREISRKLNIDAGSIKHEQRGKDKLRESMGARGQTEDSGGGGHARHYGRRLRVDVDGGQRDVAGRGV